MKIAVIGSGISGLSAAWALKDAANVTLYEKRDRVGGHSYTVDISHGAETVAVDAGFIVYNANNYPNLIALFEALGVETQPSDMSFAVSNPSGYEWSSNPLGLFAWKRNLVNPAFHRFWRTILRFNDLARAELASGLIRETTLGAWLDRNGFDAAFRENYILPMGAAIWSTPERDMLTYPAASFFRFFDNHRLMHRERPLWRTVTGGSRTYVRKFEAALGDRIRRASPVTEVGRFGTQVSVRLASGEVTVYDQVIMASHSDQSLAMLSESFADRRFLLGSVRYRPNDIFVHRDPSLMPKRRAAWAAWNVIRQGDGNICLTYWMNRLQGIPDRTPVFVTLNPEAQPREDLVFHRFNFDHPQFDLAAEAAVREIRRTNGEDGLWLAGAWTGSGFHEDGLKSGLEAALSLGGKVPWVPQGIAPRLPGELSASGRPAAAANSLKAASRNA